ncbi:hypothetical protein A2154_01855 [Candidatus Gottesmanbacteria bacterium RBG_16_43_7]|uniref:DUF4349 domain-containing protein n=1 Tax=Candidatus Gottesmanbacteria bacterium RBG_16_43_7 TaxID=1798373 RepID=A0A1F5ZBQ1_9BACT|nr:MAG: hypothetical protein A2154_01855 [Candidatus Gottesmanbacteria bacterium RBG_16_43_7]
MIFYWIKKNLLIIALLLVIIYLLSGRSSPSPLRLFNSMERANTGYSDMSAEIAPSAGGLIAEGTSSKMMYPAPEAPPQTDVTERLVIQDSNLSLLVKDVPATRDSIIDHARSVGGYMVTSNIQNPQDAPTATVIIRVPSDKLEQTLTFLRNSAIKVVSEFLNGQDVTDEYIDIDKHIAILENTKTKYQEILNQAREISDITNLTQQIINLQNQIDAYIGQQDALSKRAKLARITIYLSTDEIALPYAPSDIFRPAVIFKMAVRSLIADVRGIATKLIWAGVYAVIWIPVLAVIFIAWRFFKPRK